jgi:hypothetical protein
MTVCVWLHFGMRAAENMGAGGGGGGGPAPATVPAKGRGRGGGGSSQGGRRHQVEKYSSSYTCLARVPALFFAMLSMLTVSATWSCYTCLADYPALYFAKLSTLTVSLTLSRRVLAHCMAHSSLTSNICSGPFGC